MAEYIEREALVDFLAAKYNVKTLHEPSFAYLMVDVVTDIDDFPAADVASVVHSRWELHGDGSGTCQHCHRTQIAVWDADGWQRFCGECGARMDEGGK